MVYFSLHNFICFFVIIEKDSCTVSRNCTVLQIYAIHILSLTPEMMHYIMMLIIAQTTLLVLVNAIVIIVHQS